MDVLSDVLDLLKFKGSLYFTTKFSSPWGVQVPTYKNVARFHLAVGGECCVAVAGNPIPINLFSGDMIIIPHGAAHTLSDKIDSPIESLDSVLESTGFNGEGHLIYGGEHNTYSRLVCGHFEYDQSYTHPLLTELPDHILIEGKQALDFSWFENAMRFMSYESQSVRMGNQAIVKRLSEILFIHAIRIWSTSAGKESSFIKAISDPHVGRAIKAFHANPANNWSIELMATEAGLSRSVFADRFRNLMQTTPMQYITMWRMQKACEYLNDGSISTDLIAEQVGYQSLAAFSKVFKKTIGVGPGSYRKDKNHTTLSAH